MKTSVVPITAQSLERVLPCAAAFFAESQLNCAWDQSFWLRTWRGLLQNGVGLMFANQEEPPTGFAAVIVIPDLISGLPCAQEVYWFVLPEHRQGRLGIQLFEGPGKCCHRARLPAHDLRLHGAFIGFRGPLLPTPGIPRRGNPLHEGPARRMTIIDDFLPAATTMRENALKGGFGDVDFHGQVYHGISFAKPDPAIYSHLEKALGCEVEPVVEHFCLSGDAHVLESGAYIHADHVFAPWVALLYLTDPASIAPGSGTAFWRHKPTGWESMPSQADLVARYADKVEEFFADWRQPEQWELTQVGEQRFNRLVVYEAAVPFPLAFSFDWNHRRKFTPDLDVLVQQANAGINEIMCAVIAAGVAVAGTAAYSAYSSSQSKKDQLDYAKDNTPKFHSYDPVLAKYNPTEGVSEYTQAVNQYGGAANAAAQTENKYYQQSLEATAPGLKQGVVLAQRNANNDLRGQISPDVAAATQRASAQAGLTGGFGADSGMGRNLSARDFGLTSLQLQQQGAGELGRNAVLSAALNPVSAASNLGTAGSYANRYDEYNLTNTDRQNKAAADAAGVANQNAINQYFAGLAGVQASDINPYTNAIVSGIGSLASSYSGGGGYGGGAGGANYSSLYGNNTQQFINGNSYKPGLTGNYGFSNGEWNDIYGAANAGG